MQDWFLTTRIGEKCLLRQPKTYQFDFFSIPNDAEIDPTPHWQSLPAETRQSVTRLITRLILKHIDGERVVQRKGTNHDA